MGQKLREVIEEDSRVQIARLQMEQLYESVKQNTTVGKHQHHYLETDIEELQLIVEHPTISKCQRLLTTFGDSETACLEFDGSVGGGKNQMGTNFQGCYLALAPSVRQHNFSDNRHITYPYKRIKLAAMPRRPPPQPKPAPPPPQPLQLYTQPQPQPQEYNYLFPMPQQNQMFFVDHIITPVHSIISMVVHPKDPAQIVPHPFMIPDDEYYSSDEDNSSSPASPDPVKEENSTSQGLPLPESGTDVAQPADEIPLEKNNAGQKRKLIVKYSGAPDTPELSDSGLPSSKAQKLVSLDNT